MLQQNSYGKSTMPLLMGFTPKTQIEMNDVNERFIYDKVNQVTEYLMGRTIGTKCLKSSSTMQKSGPGKGMYKSDKKNEIDDSKYVQ